LTEEGFRVIVPDLIGHGKSDMFTSSENYTFESHVGSICELIEYLDLNDVSLIGHEIGGAVGIVAASRLRTRFSNLILCETGLPIGKPFGDLFGHPAEAEKKSLYSKVIYM
jgi:haloalkane dehalogenase